MRLPEEAILCGPLYMRWMYPFEVPDEESADFIGEDDVSHHVLEDDYQDDDAHDDAADLPSQPDYQLPSRLPEMACIAPRSHNEDAGGDPPDYRRPGILPHQCERSGKRGESKRKALKKAFKQNGYRKLEIVFKAKDQKTFKLVGRYGANFSIFVGELIKEIPHYYDSWEKVPPSDKAPLISRLQTYFDLQPHLNDETLIKINGKDKTVGRLVTAELERDFACRYSDNKCKFKDKWFNKKMVEEARREKPK